MWRVKQKRGIWAVRWFLCMFVCTSGSSSVQEFFRIMNRQFTDLEWTSIRTAGSDWDQLDMFYRHWVTIAAAASCSIIIIIIISRHTHIYNHIAAGEKLCWMKLFQFWCLFPWRCDLITSAWLSYASLWSFEDSHKHTLSLALSCTCISEMCCRWEYGQSHTHTHSPSCPNLTVQEHYMHFHIFG